MHIVFWSCRQGQAAVSSSLLAVASAVSLYFPFDVGLIQTQFSCNNLQYPFFKVQDKGNLEQFDSVGMDALLRTVKSGQYDRESLRNCAISFLDSKLHLYTQTNSSSPEMYLNTLLGMLPRMLAALDNAYDFVLADTLAGSDIISQEALRNADVIVVCFPQASWVINYFFKKCKFDTSMVFYLFGDYDPKSSCNVKNVMKQYKKYMNKLNTAYIPHNADFLNAMNSSSLVSFMLKHKDCSSTDPDYEFMNSLRTAAEKLINFAGIKTGGR